ncbi:hypothetical protein H4R21_005096, partial [Coemansia helicoidea]
IGANGQWGIFSMTIPGRVGYQCSNYYRYLVENRLLHDPNYVLDEKGKAHFLFTSKEKNPDGTAVRVFRKHRKPHVRMSREKYGYSSSSDSGSDGDGGQDDDDGAASHSATASARGGPLSADAIASAIEAAAGSSVESVDSNDTAAGAGRARARPAAAPAPGEAGGSGTARRAAARVAGGGRKRPRRGRYGGASSDEDVIRANDVELSDSSASANNTSDGEYRGAATAKRRRRINGGPDGGSSSAVEAPTRAPSVEGSAGPDGADSGGDESGLDSDGAADAVDPTNPLGDLIDPITLEPVRKPAISPYGHVMGYDSWVRCLMFPPEGSQRNVCPLTKKPLSKRDLVVLTHDNIEQYRSRIVNM